MLSKGMLFLKTDGTSLGMADWLAQVPAAATPTASPDPIGEAAEKLWTVVFEQGVPWNEAMERLEAKLLEQVLRLEGQTRSDIAKRLKTSERTLYHKLRNYRIAAPTRAGGETAIFGS